MQPNRTSLFVASLLIAATTVAHAVPARPVVAVSLSPDQHFAAVAINNREADRSYVQIWDARTGKEVSKYDSPGEGITDVAFLPDSKLLAIAVYREPVVLVDPSTAKVVRKLERAGGASTPLYGTIAIRPDGGQLAAGAEDGLYLFDLNTGKEILPAPNTGRSDGLAYTRDGKALAWNSGGTLEYWDPSLAFPKKLDRVSGLARFSRDGAYLVTSDGMSVAVLDGKTYELKAHTDPNGDTLLRGVGQLAVAPSGKWVVAATLDGLVWFELPSLKRLYTWNGPLFESSAVDYSSDGKLVLAGQLDGVARIVDVTGTKPKVLRELGIPSGPPSTDRRANAPPPDDDDNKTKPPKGYIGTAAPAGSAAVLDAVAKAADDARNPPGYGTDPTPYGKACMAAVAKAKAANIPDTAEVHVGMVDDLPGSRPDPTSGGFRYVPLRIVNSAICTKAFAAGYLEKLFQISSASCNWLAKIKEGPSGAYADDLKNPSFLAMGVSQGKECVAAVDAARKAGVADDTLVEVPCSGLGLPNTITLAELETQVCKASLGGMDQLKQADDAKTAAAYAPYLKALSGDRAKLFRGEGMLGNTYYYGAGKKRLKTPSAFKNARTWYWYSYDHDSIPQTWRVSGYKFSGDTKVGTYSKSGNGPDAPASAFP